MIKKKKKSLFLIIITKYLNTAIYHESKTQISNSFNQTGMFKK